MLPFNSATGMMGGGGLIPPPPRLVVAGNNSWIATSDDNGVSWVQRKTGSGAIRGSIGWDGVSKMVATTSNGTVEVSSDGGLSWTTSGTVLSGAVGRGCVWHPELGVFIASWVAPGDALRITTSADGFTWGAAITVATIAASDNYSPVVAGDYVLIAGAVGTSNGNGRLWYAHKSNLSSWSSVNLGYRIAAVAAGNGLIVGVGQGSLAGSARGGAFYAPIGNPAALAQVDLVDVAYPRAIVFADGRFHTMMGNSPSVYRSTADGATWDGPTAIAGSGIKASMMAVRNGTLNYIVDSTPVLRGTFASVTSQTLSQITFTILG